MSQLARSSSKLGPDDVRNSAAAPAAPPPPGPNRVPTSSSLGRSSEMPAETSQTKAADISRGRSRFEENFGSVAGGSSSQQNGAAALDYASDGELHRSASRNSTVMGQPSRHSTLKKKGSLRRASSLKRSQSARSMRAGSIRGVAATSQSLDDYENYNSVFFTPIPTSGSPTDRLAERFTCWRKFLKELVTHFREVQISYENRAKTLLRVSNAFRESTLPPQFFASDRAGGIETGSNILRDYYKQATIEANKAKEIEEEIVAKLSNLRSDLSHKIKEIKALQGDFKNSVDKEKDATTKAVSALEAALSAVDSTPSLAAGKNDPFVVRLAVDRQVERQLDEENYLHRAYLNLEGSGRELESIVVGEIQKSYGALANLLKREAEENQAAVENLRSGPIAVSKSNGWEKFVREDPQLVDPEIPLRRVQEVNYPGKDHPAAAEVRSGMLERKSKYLKSYTPGWFVLSPTHLHEFKSADRIYSQPPVMSLYLPEQKLGSHSQPGSSSHKFLIKGRQAGSMHRGHSWVFRAESYETMMAWYEDIKSLMDKSGAERDAFVRKHARTVSGSSYRAASISSDGMDEDDPDEAPYSADVGWNPLESPPALQQQQIMPQKQFAQQTQAPQQGAQQAQQRPSPGGKFPSDLQIRHDYLPTARPESSGSSEIEGSGVLKPKVNDHQHLSFGGSLVNRRTNFDDHYETTGKPSNGVFQDQLNNVAQLPGASSGTARGLVFVPMSSSSGDKNANESAGSSLASAASPNAIVSTSGSVANQGILREPGKSFDADVQGFEFPGISRQTTDTSISRLHVPGGYPITKAEKGI